MKKNLKALGIMNGTSLDGIDYSLIEVSNDLKKIVFKKHSQKQIPKKLKQLLLLAAQDKLSTYEISHLHFDLGRLYAKHVKSLPWKWDLLGLHGQTIHHQGKEASLQIGHPGFLSHLSNKPIYFDFRSADIVAGGQGAPFAPFFQKAIVSSKGPVAFHNLGGISNLTFFSNTQTIAFDSGPANILLDAWIQQKKKIPFDKNGTWASRGLPNPQVVNAFLKHPYFKKSFPKSTGREIFNLDFIKKWGKPAFLKLPFPDQMATLTEVTALSIVQSYQLLKTQPKMIYFYGGGVLNSYLMERLHFYLNPIEIKLSDDLGWPSQALESSTFAFLAAARHCQHKVHLPQVTGAKKTMNLGSLYF